MLPTASTSRYGPADGDEGLRKNVAFFEKWRKEVGPDFPLALDCYMALSVPYSIKLGKAVAAHQIKWIEEFLPPDDYDGYAEVRRALLGSSSDVLWFGIGNIHGHINGWARELQVYGRLVEVAEPDPDL